MPSEEQIEAPIRIRVQSRTMLTVGSAFLLSLGLLAWRTVLPSPLHAAADAAFRTSQTPITSRRCEQCHARPRVSDQAKEPVSLDEFGRWLDIAKPDPHSLPHRSHKTENPFYRDAKLADAIALRLWPERKEGSQSKECLACHFHPVTDEINDALIDAARSFGMGCISCHRSPETWLVPHEKWREDNASDAEKKNAGYVCLNQWDVRVETCAGCHIGSPPEGSLPLRNLTHDMYAAGHPWRPYEFRHYQEAMNPHWNIAFDRKVNPNFDAEAWFAGQVIGARSLVRLTKFRAQGPAETTQRTFWPELAAFDCFACHHDLDPDKSLASPVRADEPESLGQLEWHGDSAFPLLRRIVTSDSLQDETLAQGWDELARLIELHADRQAVVEAAMKVDEALTSYYEKFEDRPDLPDLLVAQVSQWIAMILAEQPFHISPDELTQLAYAVDALTGAAKDDQFQGDRFFEGEGVHSPKFFRPDEESLRHCLQSLLDRLKPSAP